MKPFKDFFNEISIRRRKGIRKQKADEHGAEEFCYGAHENINSIYSKHLKDIMKKCSL